MSRFLEPLEVRALADAAVDGPYREIDRAMYLKAAMYAAELKLLREWRDIVHGWEHCNERDHPQDR